MKRQSEMTVLIVGLGQIGGSIGLDLVGERIVRQVIGFDKSKTAVRKAIDRGAIDATVASLEAGLQTADIVILAMPIDVILRSLSSVLATVSPQTLCLDVASTKVAILKEVHRLKPRAGYISTHPIAGNEGCGLESAESGMLAGKVVTMTPASHTSSRQIRLTKGLVRSLGAKPIMIGAKRHDHLLAHTSHLPYALATALVQVTARTGERDKLLWQMMGGSLQSATRVARSAPDLTVNLLTTNRDEVVRSVERLKLELEHIKKLLKHENGSALRKYIEAAHHIARKRNR